MAADHRSTPAYQPVSVNTPSLLQIPMLNDQNYPMWKERVVCALKFQNVLRAIQDDPPQNGREREKFQAADVRARFVILTAISDDECYLAVNSNTAKELWIKLENKYSKKSIAPLLRQKLCNFKLHEGGDVSAHLDAIMRQVAELQVAGVELTPGEINATILNSFPSSYSIPIAHLQSQYQIDVDYTLNYLRDEGMRKSVTEATGAMSDLRLKHGNEEVVCSNCQERGHTAKFCRIKNSTEQQTGKDAWVSVRNAATSKRNNGSKQAREPLQQYTSVIFEAGFLDKHPYVKDFWLISTGTSCHVCHDRNCFVEFREERGHLFLAFGNSLPIEGTGTVKLRVSSTAGDAVEILLKDCVFVPQAVQNIVSPGRFIKIGCDFQFKEGGCRFFHPELDVEILSEKVGALSYLKDAGEPVSHARPKKCSHSNSTPARQKSPGHRDREPLLSFLLEGNIKGIECDQMQVRCGICLKTKGTTHGVCERSLRWQLRRDEAPHSILLKFSE